MVTLDYLKTIEIDPEDPPMQNFHALDYLTSGIIFLANQVNSIEQRMMQSPFKGATFWGSSDPNRNILSCYFNWFSISTVSFIRLVGLFEIMQKNQWKSKDLKVNKPAIKDHCDKYIHVVIPRIITWRNKIAAHFAATDPFISGSNPDSIGTLEMSLQNSVIWNKSHYYAGGYQWVVDGESSALPEWSLMETFIELVPRYWPNVVLKNNAAIR